MATAEAHVPPQNLEAEESVLGALMVSSGALDAVVLDVRLNEDDFYRERHRLVFRAIKRLYERSEAIDAITVSELLRSEGELEEAGGRDTVSHLASVVPVPGNAKHYAEIVKRNALLRRLLSASHTIQQSVNQREGEPRDLVERAEALLFQVAHDERSKDFSRLAEILEFEVDRLEALAKGDLEVTGTPSGFRDLDGVLGGFQPGNLITIAARPSVGKSALVCNIAENVATKYQLPVAFFSLEMSEAELAHRFIASRSRIPNDRLRKGKVAERDWPRVVRACNQLESAPLWIDESSDLSLLELRAKSRRLAASEGGKLGLVIVDYMQLMRAEDPRANRVEQVGQFSRGLKILARELDVPVIGLSQLSRAPEQRPDKRPMLSDLRESGCLTGDTRVFLPEEGRTSRIGELEGKSGFDVLAVDAASGELERRRVTNAFATGCRQVFALRTSRRGRLIRATPNHRFLTTEGWRRLDALRVGDSIAASGNGLASQVEWDPVQSIVAVGEAEVFDLTVEGLHSFVAEDIVVHNSIEQDSDVVTFIYRDALYNDEADPSDAELIVAKHRNGPIGKVDVVFLEQYPRFVDRARGGERPIEQKAGEGGPLVDLADEA